MDKCNDKTVREMLEVAKGAMQYSNVGRRKAIGACALGSSGKMYGGTCMVSIPNDYCAERVAILKALSEGEKKIEAVLITWYGKDKEIEGPCGICLNALWQLCNNHDLAIILFSLSDKRPIMKKIRDFYPHPYNQRI